MTVGKRNWLSQTTLYGSYGCMLMRMHEAGTRHSLYSQPHSYPGWSSTSNVLQVNPALLLVLLHCVTYFLLFCPCSGKSERNQRLPSTALSDSLPPSLPPHPPHLPPSCPLTLSLTHSLTLSHPPHWASPYEKPDWQT
jgi:hypothetical protein